MCEKSFSQSLPAIFLRYEKLLSQIYPLAFEAVLISENWLPG